VHILTSYWVCGAQWLRTAQSKGYPRLHASLPESENRTGFQNVMHV